MVDLERTARFTDLFYFSGENPEMNNLMGELVLNGTSKKIQWIFSDLSDACQNVADQMKSTAVNDASENKSGKASTNAAPCISQTLSNLLVAPIAQCETSTKSLRDPQRSTKIVRSSDKCHTPPVAAYRNVLEYLEGHKYGRFDFDCYLQSIVLLWKSEKHFNTIESQLLKGVAEAQQKGGDFSINRQNTH